MNTKETQETLRRLRELCPEFEDYSWVAGVPSEHPRCFDLRSLQVERPWLRVAFFKEPRRMRTVVCLGFASDESALAQRLVFARRLGDMALLIRRVFDPLPLEED